MIQMSDRTTQGFIAGMVGAVPQMLFSLTMYGFDIMKLRYLDFAAALAFNKPPNGMIQEIIAEVIVYLFTGFLGAAFSLVLKVIADENLIIKFTLYGILGWFFIYAAVTFFRVPPLYPTGFTTSLVHLIGGMIWGFGAGCSFSFLNKKYGLKN